MAAMTQDANATIEGEPVLTTVKASAADTFYRGAVVWFDRTGGTAGYAQVASLAAGDRVAGICTKKQVALAQGDPIEIAVAGLVWLPLGTAVTIASAGTYLVSLAAGLTDNPTDATPDVAGALADGDAMIGRIVDATSSQMLIDLRPGPIYDQSVKTCWY